MRKTLDISDVSSKLVQKVKGLEEYKTAKNVLLFYPLECEIDLLELLKDETKKFYLPRVSGDLLQVCPYSDKEELRQSRFKTMEPVTNPVSVEIIDLVFVPALAADLSNYRLGYGGGFYDRFLKNINAITILPIYSKFVVQKLPRESFDVPVDIIVSE